MIKAVFFFDIQYDRTSLMLKFSTIHIDPIEQCRGFKKIRADTALQHNRIAAQQHKPDTNMQQKKTENKR